MTGADRTAWQIGSALRRVREGRRWEQGRLAVSIGISSSQLARFELGQEQPSVAALAALLRTLGCSAEEYGQHLGPWDALPASK